jgi:hypothetical protein
MKRTIILLALASVAACSMASQTAKAMGCMEGAAIGGIAGHMAHHTFLGLFGGCAGGLVVHHMYSSGRRRIQTAPCKTLLPTIKTVYRRDGRTV